MAKKEHKKTFWQRFKEHCKAIWIPVFALTVIITLLNMGNYSMLDKFSWVYLELAFGFILFSVIAGFILCSIIRFLWLGIKRVFSWLKEHIEFG